MSGKGMCVAVGGHVWQGASMARGHVWQGGISDGGGHAWQAGVCMQETWPLKWAVHILRKCILVHNCSPN